MATQAVEALWQKKFRNGYAAFRGGKLTAYLLGDFSVQPWGRCGYIYLPGYALAGDEDIEIIQDLYALLGDDWVEEGIFSHSLYISASDVKVIDALFALGFGKERVDGLLDLSTINIPDNEGPPGVAIRLAGKGDNDHLGRLSPLIMSALASAPYWHPTLPEDWDELREGWAELADDKEWKVWLALENNKRNSPADEVLGMVGFCTQNEDVTGMFVSPRTAYLSVAATDPNSRGRGISTSLAWRGLHQAQKDGYEICYSNWISPNLLASRFWPRFGFQDAAYRLSKRINPMISWTRG